MIVKQLNDEELQNVAGGIAITDFKTNMMSMMAIYTWATSNKAALTEEMKSVADVEGFKKFLQSHTGDCAAINVLLKNNEDVLLLWNNKSIVGL